MTFTRHELFLQHIRNNYSAGFNPLFSASISATVSVPAARLRLMTAVIKS